MKDYTLIYKDGKSESVTYPDRKTLIDEHFNGNIEKFRQDVQQLKWDTLTIRYVQDVESGKVNAEISTADANPFGWRI